MKFWNSFTLVSYCVSDNILTESTLCYSYHMLIHTPRLSCSFSNSHTLVYCLSHTHKCKLSLTLSLPLSLSLSLSLSHTHTHTLSLSDLEGLGYSLVIPTCLSPCLIEQIMPEYAVCRPQHPGPSTQTLIQRVIPFTPH